MYLLQQASNKTDQQLCHFPKKIGNYHTAQDFGNWQNHFENSNFLFSPDRAHVIAPIVFLFKYLFPLYEAAR